MQNPFGREKIPREKIALAWKIDQCEQAFRKVFLKQNLTNVAQLILIHGLISFFMNLFDFLLFCQTLFMQFPRLVFFVAALTVTAIVMVGFTGYHVYQILTNQTTNERYKKYYLKKALKEIPPNIYNRGLLNNLFEEFFPQIHINKVLQNRTNIDTQNGVKGSGQSRNRNELNGMNKRKR